MILKNCAWQPFTPTIVVVLLALAGCGGGGSGASAPPSAVNPAPPAAPISGCDDCGDVIVGLTDADGDFLVYSVDVKALTLTRAGGATVDLLPASARVDFSQYTELAEFFTAATVPSGTYVSGTISLDYSSAEVLVEVDGVPTPATVVDADGQPLGMQQMTVNLSDRDRLVVRPGAPALLIVDFDLNASHTVDLEQSPLVAVAEPVLLAEINPLDIKTLRVRGPLASVDPEQSVYTIALRPFHLRNGNFGRARVHIASGTAFEIDGVAYKAVEGLDTLAKMPAATATLALGELDVADWRFEAAEVYAGTSVPGGNLDVVQGTVTARDGDILTVHGARLIRSQAELAFHRQMFIQIGAETSVLKAGNPEFSGGIEAISVGQRINVFGVADVDPPTRDSMTLDATAGRVRLQVSYLSGLVQSVNAAAINVSLQDMGGHPAAQLDFTGTGSPGNDAEPGDYEIGTGELSLSRTEPGAPVRVAGFVSAFGQAPPDFNAVTLVNFSTTRARLDIDWLPAGAIAPFVVIDRDRIVLDLDNANIGRRHHLRRGGIRADLRLLDPLPVLVAATDRPGIYAIRQGHSIQLFNDFGDFSTELSERLDGATTARGLHAIGGYDGSDGHFSAQRIAVRLD